MATPYVDGSRCKGDGKCGGRGRVLKQRKAAGVRSSRLPQPARCPSTRMRPDAFARCRCPRTGTAG